MHDDLQLRHYDIELGGGYEVCESYDISINGTTHTVKAISPLAMCRAEGAAHVKAAVVARYGPPEVVEMRRSP